MGQSIDLVRPPARRVRVIIPVRCAPVLDVLLRASPFIPALGMERTGVAFLYRSSPDSGQRAHRWMALSLAVHSRWN